MTNNDYHAGEVAVQARAGEHDRAERVRGAIHPTIPLAAQVFLTTQPLVVASVTEAGGRQWARLLPGPLMLVDEQTVRVPTPLAGPVGLLILDMATRRRMRVNGDAGEGLLHVCACYANCPKYIQKREAPPPLQTTPLAVYDTALSVAQAASIARADTFFIATRALGSADASHRGGNPGFVQVTDNRTLVWTDFAGNSMFNTLGNLAVEPGAGLLFPDFVTGDLLCLSGRAAIEWDGQERQVRFTVEAVEAFAGSAPLQVGAVEYSPFNPINPVNPSAQPA